MPDPILTNSLYHSFISAQSIDDEGMRKRYMRMLIKRLPSKLLHFRIFFGDNRREVHFLRFFVLRSNALVDTNLTILQSLVRHLKQVDAHSEKNKMKLHNLAVVFAPNLLSIQSLEDSSQINGNYTPSIFSSSFCRHTCDDHNA